MTFTSNSSLADEITQQQRPARDRSQEPAELERRTRYEQGKCRDCERKRRATGALCTWCRRRIEANTTRDVEKQPRRGRLSIADADDADAKLAMRSFVSGFSGLDTVAKAQHLTKFERQRSEIEPMSQLLLGVKSAFEIAKRRGQVAEWLEAIRMSLARE